MQGKNNLVLGKWEKKIKWLCIMVKKNNVFADIFEKKNLSYQKNKY